MKKLLIVLFVLCFCFSAPGEFIPIKMFGQQLSGSFAEGLVFYWRGIEAGNAVDSSLYHNDGTITGPTWTGGGLNFNTSLDNVDLGDVLDLRTGDLTVEAWFSGLTVSNEFMGLVNKALLGSITGRWALFFESGNLKAFLQGSVVGNKTASIAEGIVTDGALHQAVGVWDRDGDLTLYVDGVAVNAIDISGDSATDFDIVSHLFIGSYNAGTPGTSPGSNSNFHGVISNVRIWQRVLSSSEIQQLYINPNLPILDDPIWLLFSPPAPSAGQVIIISKAEDENEWAMPPMWACLFDNRYWLN